MADIGRMMMLAGAGIFVVGLLMTFAGRIPVLGHLPGDITIQRENFTLYAPIGTMVVVSLPLTLVVNLLARFWR